MESNNKFNLNEADLARAKPIHLGQNPFHWGVSHFHPSGA